ncbi:MAG: hypothetical protein AAFN59_08290 [Pseudomonadota bacterium]
MRNLLGLFSLLAVFALPAFAKEVQVYDCTFKNPRPFLSEKVILIEDPETGEFQVMDGIIHYEEGKPKTVKLSSDADNKFTLTWDIVIRDRNGQTAKLIYRFVYFKNNGKANYSMFAASYENRELSRGTCQKAKQNV